MEFIDDHPVVGHRVRFRGRADITDDQAILVRDNNTMIWLVRARCLPPQYHPVSADSDERYRFNIQDIEGAIPLDGDARTQGLAYLDHGAAQGYLTLDVPSYPDNVLDFDPDPDLAEALAYLETHDQRRPGETLVDVLRRLIDPAPPAPLAAIPEPGVERLGSVYGPGHSGRTQAILEEAFGGEP